MAMPPSSFKTTSSADLKSPYHYIVFSATPSSPSITNELSFRRLIQNALTQAFGTSFANTYLDILSFQYPIQHVNRQSLSLHNPPETDSTESDVVKVVIRVASE
jgi:hypothetical protein